MASSTAAAVRLESILPTASLAAARVLDPSDRPMACAGGIGAAAAAWLSAVGVGATNPLDVNRPLLGENSIAGATVAAPSPSPSSSPVADSPWELEVPPVELGVLLEAPVVEATKPACTVLPRTRSKRIDESCPTIEASEFFVNGTLARRFGPVELVAFIFSVLAVVSRLACSVVS